MFTFDRETATAAAMAMCIAGTIYMYMELKKTKDDISDIKTVIENMHRQYTVQPLSAIPEIQEENSIEEEPVVEKRVTRSQVSEKESSE